MNLLSGPQKAIGHPTSQNKKAKNVSCPLYHWVDNSLFINSGSERPDGLDLISIALHRCGDFRCLGIMWQQSSGYKISDTTLIGGLKNDYPLNISFLAEGARR